MRFIESEIEGPKLRRWVADAVSRTIFMIAFACVRFGGSRRRELWGREGQHVSSGRRVHNTDASIILEILPGIKRDQETRASSHAYVCPCTQAEYRLPSHYFEGSNFIPAEYRALERAFSPKIRSKFFKDDGPIYIASQKNIFYESDHVEWINIYDVV